MRWPDPVTILRPDAADEYDNPGRSLNGAALVTAPGFLVTPELLLLPPFVELATGHRVRVNGALLLVTRAAEVRSPARRTMWTAAVAPIVEASA